MGCKEADMTERLALYFTSSIPDLVPAGFWARVGLSPGKDWGTEEASRDLITKRLQC